MSDDRSLPLIEEAIVVEGRDDTQAIKRAVRAITIETHGFGISEDTWKLIESEYERRGLIVFTDPDHAGKEIRKRILEKYPESKEAFLPKGKALKKGDIGIENAEPDDIREALSKARATYVKEEEESDPLYSIEDLDKAGLTGGAGAKERRDRLGDILGIGYYNSKALLRRLNLARIPREDFHRAIDEIKEGE